MSIAHIPPHGIWHVTTEGDSVHGGGGCSGRKGGALMSICTVSSHRAAVADDSQWSAFKRVAIWVLGGEKHDVRNCPHCDSSFDRLIPRPASQRLQFIPIISSRDVAMERARQLFASVEAELAVAL